MREYDLYLKKHSYNIDTNFEEGKEIFCIRKTQCKRMHRMSQYQCWV